jgi:hypothetical protein
MSNFLEVRKVPKGGSIVSNQNYMSQNISYESKWFGEGKFWAKLKCAILGHKFELIDHEISFDYSFNKGEVKRLEDTVRIARCSCCSFAPEYEVRVHAGSGDPEVGGVYIKPGETYSYQEKMLEIEERFKADLAYANQVALSDILHLEISKLYDKYHPTAGDINKRWYLEELQRIIEFNVITSKEV